ncbi:MAG: YbaK/EbsC family protein [Sedimentisphaerales bacterium]|nr:YbaK/EbsC family protein [Sedimentisphaerales bacterium]
MQVIEFLKKAGVPYQLSEHPSVFTAQQVAAVEHEPGRFVAKPVLVKADGTFLLCVLPAPGKIDLVKLKQQTGAKSVVLADEKDMSGIFTDCELGAEPPFGKLYNLSTIMDKGLEKDDHILFQAGTHEQAVHMSLADYKKLAEPQILDIAV